MLYDDAVPPAYIHPTAVVDPGAELGDDTKVWHFCHVSPGAKIGRGCVLGQNVFIASNVRIGDGVRIQNNVSIYDGVTIENNVFIGPSAVFTNVSHPRAEVNRKGAFEPTLVKYGATIGANSTIVCGREIGEYGFVGAGAVITHNVVAYSLVIGVPARQVGWMCQCGEGLPAATAHGIHCKFCDRWYHMHGDRLLPTELHST